MIAGYFENCFAEINNQFVGILFVGEINRLNISPALLSIA